MRPKTWFIINPNWIDVFRDIQNTKIHDLRISLE